MARSPNCTGAPLYKGRVDVTISYPDPDETLLDTPIDLPTSEPAEAQISYTLGSQHMPVWSPFELGHVKIGFLYSRQCNSSDSVARFYFRVLKNGESVASGSTSDIAKGGTVGLSHYYFFDVKEGDVLSCRMWTSVVGCTWDRGAVVVVPSRVRTNCPVIADLVIQLLSENPLSFGAKSYNAYRTFRHGATALQYNNESFEWYPATLSNISLPVWAEHSTTGLWMLYRGDMALNSTQGQSAEGLFIYTKPVTRISYTPLNLRV